MATVTERVADDMIHQELRAIGENSAADGQVLPKYLDISRDPLPPSVDESKQEADALDWKKGSMYSSLPPGGIPGVSDGAVM